MAIKQEDQDMWIMDRETRESIREMTEEEKAAYEAAVAALPTEYERQVGVVDASLFGLDDDDYPDGVFGE